MKKITAIVLLICLILSSTGYHFVFRLYIGQAKADMKKYLLHNPRGIEGVEEFCFSNEKVKQLDWENEHEFFLSGHMYDVIDKEWKDGRLTIRCLADEKETALVDQYMKINKSNSSGNKPLASLIQLISSQFLQPSDLIPDRAVQTIHTSFHAYSSAISVKEFPVHTPPPRIC